MELSIKIILFKDDTLSKIMWDDILSDETLLMIYEDVERELKDGDDTRSKGKKGSRRTT